MNRQERRRKVKQTQQDAHKKVGVSRRKPVLSARIGREEILRQAMVNHRDGSLEHAERGYRDVLQRQPGHPVALKMLGAVLGQLGQLEASVTYCRQALTVNSQDASVHYSLGLALFRQEDFSGAEVAFRDTIRYQPDHLHAHIDLAILLERLNRLSEARVLANQALQWADKHPLALLTLARCDRRQDRIEEALARLQRLSAKDMTPRIHREWHFEKANLHDRLSQSEEAYGHFLEGNRLLNAPLQNPEVQDYPDWLRRMQLQWTQENQIDCAINPPDDAFSPVFLVGFPRSGTTLLDRILGSHPQVLSLEERPILREVRAEMGFQEETFPERIFDLTPKQLLVMRALYRKRMRHHLVASPYAYPVVVDKMPLNLVEAGLIYRLFPQSRFILALRHPCDVCLSCFMQPFSPNPAMIHFATLEGSARFYNQVMALWQHYVNLLPLSVHMVRYEKVVTGFEREVGALLAFLGVLWHEDVSAFSQRSVGQHISTPSYHQVSQPLYTRSTGRWHSYKDRFQPVMPILQPWIESWGYAE